MSRRKTQKKHGYDWSTGHKKGTTMTLDTKEKAPLLPVPQRTGTENLMTATAWAGDKRFKPPILNRWYPIWQKLVMKNGVSLYAYTMAQSKLTETWVRHPIRHGTLYRINSQNAEVYRPNCKDYKYAKEKPE